MMASEFMGKVHRLSAFAADANMFEAKHIALIPLDSSSIDDSTELCKALSLWLPKATYTDHSTRQQFLVLATDCFLASFALPAHDIHSSTCLLNHLSRFLADLKGAAVIQQKLEALMSLLLPLLPISVHPIHRRLATTCLSHMCVRLPAAHPQTLPTLRKIHDAFLSIIITSQSSHESAEMWERCVSAGVKGYQLLCSENKAIVVESVGAVVVALAGFVFGDVGRDGSPVKNDRQRRTSGGANWRKHSSSAGEESEVSDVEGWRSTGIGGERYSKERLKVNALHCLQTLAKAHPKLLYQKWDLFLSPPPIQSSLFALLLNPSTPSKVTIAASLAVNALLENSSSYLSVAQEDTSKRESSFTSLSAKLASTILHLHACFLTLLSRRMDLKPTPATVTDAVAMDYQIQTTHFATLRTLISQSPYQRIASRDLRAATFEALVTILGTPSPLDASALAALNALFTAGHILSRDACTTLVQGVLLTRLGRSNDGKMSDIESFGSEAAAAVRVAALEALAALLRTHHAHTPFDVLETQVLCTSNSASAAREGSFGGNSALEFVAAVKCVQVYANAVSSLFASATTPSTASAITLDADSAMAIATSPETAEFDVSFWNHLLETYVGCWLSDKLYAVRALGVETAACVPPQHVSYLTERARQVCSRGVVALCDDVEESVRICVGVCLGVYVASVESWFVKDSEFMCALAEKLPDLTRDKALLVRVRASWAVANLADTLASLQPATDNFSNIMWKELLQSAIDSANDNEKCRSNGVRAVGNLLRVASQDSLSIGLEKEVGAILKNINVGAFKVRWNACYAAYNLFLSPVFLATHRRIAALPKLISALTTALTSSKNYKVRMNAAVALSVGRTNSMYAGKVDELIGAVGNALAHVDDLVGIGYTEVRYRKELEDHLTSTLQHLRELSN